MKKTLIFGLFLLSTVVFSHMHGDYGGNDYMRGGYGPGMGMYQTLTPEQQKELNLLENEIYRVRSRYMVDIQTKQFEIERLMLQDNVDWKKVERLNQEVAMLQANMTTEIMKHQKQISDITGYNYMPGMQNMGRGYNHGGGWGRW